MPIYVHGRKEWQNSYWKQENIAAKLAALRYRQGRLLGSMEGIGIHLRLEAHLDTLTLDILATSGMEGVDLNPDRVKSSIAWRLGMDTTNPVPADRPAEGIIEIMLDATQNHNAALTDERLLGWYAAIFPIRRTGIHRPVAGKEKVHFQTPNSDILVFELNKFLNWFNSERSLDPVIKAAVAHLWFVSIHLFGEGNGRIAGAITDMQLSRADQSAQRFYSISSQLLAEGKKYADILEKTQKGSLDITAWLDWFLNCLDRALTNTNETLAVVMKKARFWEKHASTPLNDRQRTMLNKLLNGLNGPKSPNSANDPNGSGGANGPHGADGSDSLAGKLTSSKWATITKTSQDTAGRDITDLLQRGILSKEPRGGRSTSYRLSLEALSGHQ